MIGGDEIMTIDDRISHKHTRLAHHTSLTFMKQ